MRTKNTSLAVLFSMALSTAMLMPQSAPKRPERPKGAQEFLNVPVWYLTYRFSVVCRDTGAGERGGSWSVDSERIISGSAELGIRSQGPSLSLASGSLPEGEEVFNMIDNFANWIGGCMPDESKSQEEWDAALARVLEANHKSFEKYRFNRKEEHPGVVAESSGPAGMDRERVTMSGSATVGNTGDFALEIDAEKKKFKLKFVSGFNDTMQSMTAVRGERVVRVGAPDEFHHPIETSMHAGTDEVASGGPRDGIIEGILPDSFGNLSGSFSYPVRMVSEEGYRGTMVIQFALSPELPEEVELIIEPPADYLDWRPLGFEDETSRPGNLVPIEVHLQKRGGGVPKVKATRFKYRLVDTSREKGVCMNWPLRPADDPPRDLQFEPDRNEDLIIGDDERQSASRDGQDMTEGKVVISCFDYGASSTFTAEALLDDGRTILGRVKGSQFEYLKLPARDTDSRIASVFLKNRGVSGLKDDDDSENDPVGDEFKGDGLTLFEEYRGFKHGDDWITGDPKAKDVFILNQMRGMEQVLRGIEVFEIATQLNVHGLLRSFQVNDEMVINFNYTDGPHVVDQHVIRILAGQSGGDYVAAFVEAVGTPGTAKAVRMPPNWPEFKIANEEVYESFAATLAHEMLHACNVYHHGVGDKMVLWKYVAGPPAQVKEFDSGLIIPITIKDENQKVISPSDFFRSPDGKIIPVKMIWVGVEHGQHSGEEDCLMRYNIADAYRSKDDPSVRYLAPEEPRGQRFCIDIEGTARYGSAAPPGAVVLEQRGKCRFQLRVNDFGQEPKR